MVAVLRKLIKVADDDCALSDSIICSGKLNFLCKFFFQLPQVRNTVPHYLRQMRYKLIQTVKLPHFLGLICLEIDSQRNNEWRVSDDSWVVFKLNY